MPGRSMSRNLHVFEQYFLVRLFHIVYVSQKVYQSLLLSYLHKDLLLLSVQVVSMAILLAVLSAATALTRGL